MVPISLRAEASHVEAPPRCLRPIQLELRKFDILDYNTNTRSSAASKLSVSKDTLKFSGTTYLGSMAIPRQEDPVIGTLGSGRSPVPIILEIDSYRKACGLKYVGRVGRSKVWDRGIAPKCTFLRLQC
jgi:hypothetical protein